MPQKIVINSCHGGFGLSDEATALYGKLAGLGLVRGPDFVLGKSTWYVNEIADENFFYDGNIPRDCEHLVQVVLNLGKLANSRYSDLKIVEIPEGVDWTICEYDGMEWVAETHRTWS
jgi:hypothetical protein